VKTRRITIISIIILLCISAAAYSLRRLECLTATCGGRLLFAVPISPGESFEITFTHSLNLSPITDVVEWTGEGLIVRKSIFKTFGAGVPVPSDGIGEELVRRADGSYELTGIDKPMDSISILTSSIPNHSITFDGHEFFLLELAGTGEQVVVEVKTVFS
jgi:hypothetical protein